MKLLFVHNSARVKFDDTGNMYTNGSYSMKIWERYLRIFDSITLLMRRDSASYTQEEAAAQFNFISPERISFRELPNRRQSLLKFFNPKVKKERSKIIEEYVKKSDGVIVRLPGVQQAVTYANKYGKPCLVEVVGCPFGPLWHHSFRGKLMAIPSYFRLKKVMKQAPNAIYVTSQFLQNRYPTPGRQIGCSDVALQQLDETVLARRQAHINQRDGQKTVIGTAGAVHVAYKGQKYVIQALGKLKKKGITNFEYQLAGGGSQAALRKLAKKCGVEDQVVFMGSLPHDEVFRWLDSIDLYVQPSRYEGLPRALVEAMSRGLPAFGTNTGGIPELLDGKYLFSNNRENVREIAEILLGFTREDRLSQAERNFAVAKEYQQDVLDNRRNDFMMQVFCNKE